MGLLISLAIPAPWQMGLFRHFTYGAADKDSLSWYHGRVMRSCGWSLLTWPGLRQQHHQPGCQHHPTTLCHLAFPPQSANTKGKIRNPWMEAWLWLSPYSQLALPLLAPAPAQFQAFTASLCGFFAGLLKLKAVNLLCRELCILLLPVCQL